MTYQEEIKNCIGVKFNESEFIECGDINKNIPLSQSMQVSVDLDRRMDFDYIPHIIDVVNQNFSIELNKLILKDFFKQSQPILIDRRDSSMNTNELSDSVLKEFVHICQGKGRSITSAKVVIELLETSSQYEFYNNTSLSSSLRCVGRVYDIDIFVDSYLPWSDNFIMHFRSLDYNIELDHVTLGEDNVLSVGVKYGYQIDDPKMIYIFTDELNDNLDVLIRHQRREKIKKLLN